MENLQCCICYECIIKETDDNIICSQCKDGIICQNCVNEFVQKFSECPICKYNTLQYHGQLIQHDSSEEDDDLTDYEVNSEDTQIYFRNDTDYESEDDDLEQSIESINIYQTVQIQREIFNVCSNVFIGQYFVEFQLLDSFEKKSITYNIYFTNTDQLPMPQDVLQILVRKCIFNNIMTQMFQYFDDDLEQQIQWGQINNEDIVYDQQLMFQSQLTKQEISEFIYTLIISKNSHN